jgi:hypothetical protein
MQLSHQLGRFDVDRVLIAKRPLLNAEDEGEIFYMVGDLGQFPYVNGDLFNERLRIPAFDAATRSLLIDACECSWDAMFSALITEQTNPDGSDTGPWLSQLFEVLNTPLKQRQQSLDQGSW